MNSNLKQLKSKLKILIKNKDVIDVVVFGSFIKGKSLPRDVDLAIISNKKIKFEKEGFHIISLTPQDFLVNPPKIVSTLLREGYSLKKNKFFGEIYNFEPRVLFSYRLSDLNPSKKVSAVNILRGSKRSKGLVEESKGKWLANQVFTIPLNSEFLFNDFFLQHKIKHTKMYLLIH